MKYPFWQSVYDFLLAPLRLLFLPDAISTNIGLTSLESERINAILPYVKGRLLDIGAGKNNLVRVYGNGIGIDVHDFGGGALIVPDSAQLPFENSQFDTITFLACLNHIPNRRKVLLEVNRLLKENGCVLITMINPVVGFIGHKIWWYSEDKQRKMKEGELDGLWPEEIEALGAEAGFKVVSRKKFVYGINNLYVLAKIANGGIAT